MNAVVQKKLTKREIVAMEKKRARINDGINTKLAPLRDLKKEAMELELTISLSDQLKAVADLEVDVRYCEQSLQSRTAKLDAWATKIKHWEELERKWGLLAEIKRKELETAKARLAELKAEYEIANKPIQAKP